MIDIYLFDWGNTLMVDFPGVPGRMCDWPVVEAIDGASEALASLSAKAEVYIATGAADSSEADIGNAFARVGLDQFVSGYFCQANLGIAKGSAEFLPTILHRLGKQPYQAAMVGDNFDKDIEPALRAGVFPIWLTQDTGVLPGNVRVIRSLRELCDG